MAVVGKQVTVTTTPTRLDTADIGSERLKVRNPAAGATVFLGGATVDDTGAAAGFGLLTGTDSPELDLREGDALYGVVAAGTQVVHVIEAGV